MEDTTYILIDSSYMIFYRVYALVNWWKLSHKDESFENLHSNEEFIEKFKNVFQRKLLELRNKLKIHKNQKVKYIVGKDCPRENIWRVNLYSKYKDNRIKNTKNLNPYTFFKLVFEEHLFQKTLENLMMVENENLECDDCLAICAKYIQTKTPNSRIFIIASDKDYMQLYNDKVNIYDLRYKSVVNNKSSLGCPKKDLLLKIINGDKSDNIPCIFGRTNNKETKKCMENIDYFYELLNKYDKVLEQYKLNKRLIDFNEIPKNLRNNIITKIRLFIS